MTPDAALLRALRAAETHLLPSELAAQMQVSAAMVDSQIAGLRAAGFTIEERPGLGYRLLDSPDRLMADDLLARLGKCELVREIVVFEEVDSTNERAFHIGSSGAASGLVLFAERQRAGRGRFGRRWESASHLGLWCSLLVRLPIPLQHWPRLTTWTAVALASALEKTLGVRMEIKWPNDLQSGSRKLAGILIELGLDRAQEHFAVVGFGINANHTSADFPPELADRATSLRALTGRTIDRPALAAAILAELDRLFPLIGDRFAELLAEASDRSALLGKWIRVQNGPQTIEGVAEMLDTEGQLVLRTADGAAQVLSAGEVTIGREPM